MTDRTAPVFMFNDKEQQWLDGAIKDKLLRQINFDDIHELQMGVASGGFGVIHAGLWRDMRVAVKVLYNSADFIQEVGIHKLVQDSENIVKFYGITQIRGTGDYGMVLQFAGKGSLRDYLSKHFHLLDWTNKMRLARDVAAGISFIHEDNICHHDLHSRNVLIDQSGRALITDFGLSRYLNNAASNNGVRGVVPYISPERLKNTNFDRSSDVYSLGVIMWELTSGIPPFYREGENFLLPLEIIKGKRENIVPGTPVEYSDLYQQCWDGEPMRRPPIREILKTLNLMLRRHNSIQAEEDGTIQTTLPGNVSGPRSLPTATTQIPIVHSRNSEPIVGQISMEDPSLKGGNPAKQIVVVKPLQPKRDRSVTVVVADPEPVQSLANQFNLAKISEGQQMNPTMNPSNRPPWIKAHTPGSPVRSASPKPVTPTLATYDVPRQSLTSSGYSITIPEISPKLNLASSGISAALPEIGTPSDDFEEKGEPADVLPRSTYPLSPTPSWMPRDGRSKIRDFFIACRNGNLEAVKWHLAHGANVMEPYENMSGRTPLHAAAMSNSLEVMTLLCESAGRNLNLNELDDGSQTPLHLLTHYGNSEEILKYMLMKGADPNAQDSERRTPLMTAVILKDNAVFVETLLDYGADPNIKCQENNALAEAAIRLRYHCVKVLLDTDLSMSEQSSLKHALDVCYNVVESLNRNQVLSLLVRWNNAEGLQKRQTLATMILRGSLPFGELRIDQRKLARQVLNTASH
ncbi:hypothetical protein BGZ49_008413 [Haplosporangium sp. Z 27]|nr:hypothetical protein BGZ49_008413 [Haplosporangium sp. Z 27]